MRRIVTAFTLIEVLVVIAIIGILAAVYFMPKGGVSSRPDGKGTTVPGAVMYKARDTECKNNLSQIRQLIYVQVETNGDDSIPYPETLKDVRGLPSSMHMCPIGKEPYTYTPEDGKVSCPHPGHEKY